MGKKELAGRLRYAREKGRGVTLTPGEVVEVMDGMEEMSGCIMRLSASDIVLRVPVVTVLDSLPEMIGLRVGGPALTYWHSVDGYRYTSDGLEATAGHASFSSLIESMRIDMRLDPLTDPLVTVSGGLICDQLLSSNSAV